MPQSLLFTPTKLRTVTLRNRIVLSPMCTYSADGGMASDWHMVHLGQFALGGAGVVFTEVTAVTEQGRITYGDLGIWSNAHVAPLARVADVVRAHGAVPARHLDSLLTCPLSTPLRVTRVADQDPAFLRFIESSGLKPGEAIVQEPVHLAPHPLEVFA
jgi:hypothetical protein